LTDKNRTKRLSLTASVYAYFKTFFDGIIKVIGMLSHPRKRKILLKNSGEFLKAFYHKITNEGVLKDASSLAYITLLGFVPFVAFLFMITPDLPFLNVKEKISDLARSYFIPGSADVILRYLDDFIQRRTAFNVVGFIILFVTSYSLFRSIRNTFDRILGTTKWKPQGLMSQLIKFFGTLIFGLIIMVLLFSATSLPIISMVLKLPFLKPISVFAPVVLQFFGFIMLYTLLPSVRVSRKALFWGAFWTTVVWMGLKSGFDAYIYNLTSIQRVYGVMSALPILLTWIYFNWVIIIGGIVLVGILENGKDSVPQKISQRSVRITMEMYSDDRLERKLEGLVDKKALISTLQDEHEEEDQ